MKSKKITQIKNLIIPAIVFGSFTGMLTSLVVVLYELCAHKAIALSEAFYCLLRERWYLLPVILPLTVGIAFVLGKVYKKIPNIKGGGIPTTIGILRDVISFKWLRTLIGTFAASLLSFLIGIPLGTEGPSVMMGTSIGMGVTIPVRSHEAWSRYSMTGGACAGFSVATGAPVSGIVFAIEEAHQRISPMIFLVSAVAVTVSHFTTEIIAPVFGVEPRLFPSLEVVSLSVSEIWLPLVIGVLFGIFAVVFLKWYRLAASAVSGRFGKIPAIWRISAVIALTLVFGMISFQFISTGHHLIGEVMEGHISIVMLGLILLARCFLTVAANTNSLTGGIFLPLMAMGAVFAGLIASVAVKLGLDQSYYTAIVVIGISACISGMMKMPLTAIIFSVEALSCGGNIIHVVVASTAAFAITEIFGAECINDTVLEHRLSQHKKETELRVFDTFVTVQKDSFAVGKQVRDILWPANFFVLSVRHSCDNAADVDAHGAHPISEGDVIHIRYSTENEEITKKEITAIVGDQNYAEFEDTVI